MRALPVLARGAEAEVHDLPDRDPGPGEVRVTVEAASVNGFDAERGARVVATARPGAASDVVRRLGAADTVDHTADLTGQVRAAAPEGVTKVVHAAGDPVALAAMLAPGGRLVSVLGADPALTGRDDVTITALLGQPTGEKLASSVDAVASGRLTVPVAGTRPFAEAAEAMRDFATPKLGKLVVTAP